MRRTIVALNVALFMLAAFAPSAFAAGWKGSFDASYQAAKPGDVIPLPTGTISGQQVIQWRSDLANLAGGCTPADTSKCIRFVATGPLTINGVLEIRGSNVWVDGSPAPFGTPQIAVRGYVDTEANSNAQHPDHVIVEGTRSPIFGVFNTDTVTFRDMDVGPATVSGATCGVLEGPFGSTENKIGFGGGVSYVPRDVTLDGLFIHDQNGDRNREVGDCHWGGLFIVTVDGLTIRNSRFQGNVVYNVQIQNYDGPQAKRVLFDNNSFACPVEWKYIATRCDAQDSIQFDYDPKGEFRLRNNVTANGTGGTFGCYVGSCGGLASLILSGNVELPDALVAPPLLNGGTPPPPPPPPVCSGSGGTTTLALTKISETATTVTFGWTPVPGADGYKFFTSAVPGRYSSTNDPLRSTVRFGKIQAGGCYYVRATMPGPGGGVAAPGGGS